MKIRRILATAVAAAVTTPVVFLSAAPAFADTKPTAPAQTQEQKPTIEQLKLAVAAAQKAYDAAVVAFDASQKAIDALDKADHPLVAARDTAKKTADEKAAAKTAADEKVTKAEADLAGLPADATAEQKEAAQKAVDDAKAAAATAATEKTTADEALKTAQKALEEARAAAFTELGTAQKTKEEALKALKAAEKALEEAEEEGPHEDCKDVSETLKLDLNGPKKIVAGTSADFTLKFTNGTGQQLDEVSAFASAFTESGEEGKEPYLDLKWSVGGSKWEPLDDAFGVISVGAMKPGAKADIKLRLTVDAKAPAGQGAVVSAGGYDNNDGSCGFGEEADILEFAIEAKKGDKPAPGKDTGTTDGTTPQGGTSTTPVTGGTTGSLAKTGSSDVMPQIALAGAAAVALGAGAMFVVRRRKAGADA